MRLNNEKEGGKGMRYKRMPDHERRWLVAQYRHGWLSMRVFADAVDILAKAYAT